MKSRKIVYLLPNLESGGTERHALTLARLIDRSRFALSLVTTAGGGALYDQFQALLPLTVFGETAQGRRFRRGWVLERDPRGDGSGLPVVASRAGGNPETVADGETGVLIPPGYLSALAVTILRMLQSRELAAKM